MPFCDNFETKIFKCSYSQRHRKYTEKKAAKIAENVAEDKKLVGMVIVSYNDNKEIINGETFWRNI